MDQSNRGSGREFEVYCDMKTDGGGWILVNQNIADSSIGFGENGLLRTRNHTGDCGRPGTNFILSNFKVPYSEYKVYITRESTILQCSKITNNTGSYYFDGSNWVKFGMCNWGDGIFAHSCCNPANFSGLKKDWLIRGNYAPSLKYTSECSSSSDNGYFSAYAYIREDASENTNFSIGSSFPKSSYLIQTTGQINTLDWNHLNTMSFKEETPLNTSIKYLISFDKKQTWRYFDGTVWKVSSLKNIEKDGMTKSEIEALTQNDLESAGGFVKNFTVNVDFAISLKTSDLNSSPSLDQITINYETPAYDTSNPYIINNIGQPYSNILSFNEELNQGTTTYQLSNNGSSFYYFNGTNWVSGEGSENSNGADVVNTNLAQFIQDVGVGDFYFKAFLNSNEGLEQVELDSVSILYEFNKDPVIGSITPNSATNIDASVPVVIHGENFLDGASAKLTKLGEEDIPCSNVIFVSENELTCNLNLSLVSPGLWNVTVTNPDTRNVTLKDSFTIIDMSPKITNITPSIGNNNTAKKDIVITGTNFKEGLNIRLTKPGYDPINALNITLNNENEVSCSFDLRGKEAGDWDVSITNPNTQFDRVERGFKVEAVVSKLGFITMTQTIKPDTSSTRIIVEAQDYNGNTLIIQNDATLNLETTSKTGEFSLNSDTWNSINSVTILSGESSISFYYKDSVKGTFKLSAIEIPDQGWINAEQIITIDTFAPAVWPFDNPLNYTFDNSKIGISNSLTTLKGINESRQDISLDFDYENKDQFIYDKGISFWGSAGILKGKTIQISGTNEDLTDYQLLLTIDTQTLINQGQMQTTCADMRFKDSDKTTSLSYFIESGCNTTNTKVWVKVPLIPTTGTTIYMTYNDPTLLPESNEINVFGEKRTVSNWKLDGNATDSWGSNNGNLINFNFNSSSGWMPESECVSGKCLKFDGVNDYIGINGGSSLKNNKLTYSLWIKASSFVSSSSKSAHFIYWPQGDAVGFILGPKAQAYTKIGGTRRSVKSSVINLNEWFFLTFTYNGQFEHFYTNGIKTDGLEYVSQTISYPGNLFALGTADDLVSYCYNGSIDDVQIYNQAISELEIKQTYLSGLTSLYSKGQVTEAEYNAKVAELIIPTYTITESEVPVNQTFLVETNLNSINTQSWNEIQNILIDQIEPENTSIKYLVSFDQKQNWKYWSGQSFEKTINTNDGNSGSIISSLTADNWKAPGGFIPGKTKTLDFLISFKTLDPYKSPSVNQITINYDTSVYDLNSPVIINKNPQSYWELISFSEILGKDNKGSIKYQISNNGSDWYYWNNDLMKWTLTVENLNNSAEEINAHISQFVSDIDFGDFYFKAYLNTEKDTDPVKLDGVVLGYRSYNYEIVILNSGLSLMETEPGEVNLEFRDIYGNTIVLDKNIVLDLLSSSSYGFFAIDLNEDISTRWSHNNITIPSGTSNATFYYKDNQKGVHTIYVNDREEGVAAQASSEVSIKSRYKFLVTGVTNPVRSGTPSSVTVQAVNYNNESLYDYEGTVRFISNDGAAVLPQDFTFTQEMLGQHVFTNGVTLITQKEDAFVEVVDINDENSKGRQENILVAHQTQCDFQYSHYYFSSKFCY